MKYFLIAIIGLFTILSCTSPQDNSSKEKAITVNNKTLTNQTKKGTMKLGAFSLSLSVKDLGASRKFYESLGFEVLADQTDKNYLIMKNETTLIGLFQGMFEGNIMTFNPGWDENGKNVDGAFDDVRTIQKQLKGDGISLMTEADESTTGPASLMVTDPDGNLIMVDQHR